MPLSQTLRMTCPARTDPADQMRPGLFAEVLVDPVKQARQRLKPPATRDYIIHFTARSGSTWLKDILAATGQLSAANEAFNPAFVPRIAQALNATGLDDYIDALRRRFNTGGIYGAEVTAPQIKATFGSYDAFHARFAGAQTFWLIRQDIVAQAVSLAKMVTTNVAHNTGDADAAQAEAAFAYDARVIRRWLNHVRLAEQQCEAWFAQHGVSPLRMSYEQVTRLSPVQVVNLVARHLCLPDIAPMEFAPRHTKLGTGQNSDYAARFRQDEARWLAPVEAERAPMLARLDPVQDMVRDLA